MESVKIQQRRYSELASEIKEKLRKTVSNLKGSHAVKHVAERIANRRVD